MDLMFLLDGAVWAWRARRTSVAEGESGSIGCVFGGVLDSVVSVTGSWLTSRSLERGGDATLAFCYKKARANLVSQLMVNAKRPKPYRKSALPRVLFSRKGSWRRPAVRVKASGFFIMALRFGNI